MNVLFIILTVLTAILMIGVVLVQKSKGGGLSSTFGGGNQVLGVRGTNKFLEKATWTLAATIIVLCIVATFVIPQRSARHSNIKNQIEQTVPVEGIPDLPMTTEPEN